MKQEWDINLTNEIDFFLTSLKEDSNNYKFRPALEGLTDYGVSLDLGFSCYALKCYYMLGLWEKLDNKVQNEWKEYINNFQLNAKDLPESSYIDPQIVKHYISRTQKYSVKNVIKNLLYFFNIRSIRTSSQYYKDSIRAETKQAISTLFQVGFQNKKKYTDFPKTHQSIEEYLNSLDWKKPWNAGAQFSAICVFTSTQLDAELKKENESFLYDYLQEVLDKESGFYHQGNDIDENEKINGAMKVISGLDWINRSIHYPEKIIDYCLNVEPGSEGCDLVDLVYVLYKTCSQSNYKKEEVKNFVNEIKLIIRKNYHPEKGGFSYFQGKSQTHYYGLNISLGKNTPDLHGTTLLLWALTMIDHINGNARFKIIKP